MGQCDRMCGRKPAGLELCDLEHRSSVVHGAGELECDGLEQVGERPPRPTTLPRLADDAGHLGDQSDAAFAGHHPDGSSRSGDVHRAVGERSRVGGGLGSSEPALDVGGTVGEQRIPGSGQPEHGVRASGGGIEHVEPPADRGDVSARQRGPQMSEHLGGCIDRTAARERLIDGGGPFTVHVVPLDCPAAQRCLEFGSRAPELTQEHFGKERVVAEDTGAGDRDDEDVAPPDDLLQMFGAARVIEDVVTQLT